MTTSYDELARAGAKPIAIGWWVTAGFAVVAAAASLWRELRWGAAAYEVAMMLAGTVLFVIGFLRSARRSRHEVLTVAGTFFLLDGVAPRVRRVLLAQVTLQVAIAIVAATLRRYGAFAILAPVFGVGLMAFWGATWGVFPARGAHPRKSGPPAPSSS